MKEISLTNGRDVTLVDDEDFPFLNEYRWHKARVYPCTAIRMTSTWTIHVKMHNVLLQAPPGFRIDHQDRNPLNNQKANLRFLTRSQNAVNADKRLIFNGRQSSSRFKGVCWRNDTNKWMAYIGGSGEAKSRIYLGHFISEIEAASAYNQAAILRYGNAAVLNSI